MGRDATKAAGNPWYQARKKAAEYDDRLCSRESAAEQLGMSVSSLADAELGNTKFMPVDKAVLMADRYNAMGFPPDYIIDRDYMGNPYPKNEQVARCGNAVCPPMAAAVARANFPEYVAKVGDTITTMAALLDMVAV